MAFQKERSAGFLANHMARLFATGLQQRIRPLGLAPAQFMTLLALWEQDGLTQRELVLRLSVEQATMANTLIRMERDGLIERRSHPEDGRSQSIHLTARAFALREPATQAARSQNEAAMAGFSEDERHLFLDLMRRAIASMQTD
ncbi:MarR family transcriptional regulator [Mesorhizobium sp. PAMC28654]|uniref:MarR family winged helix-turn-helix transcriptional regulator n=1 Tax=Mesorhizobium sp. PAMC28654 TaxID=2880934 RepID=UPI001D0B3A2E|nr:MarR family transcriptional regulator [Mesorhizobium sp. PAMC28654]UDL92653.1 MarR family transcriptional regulator [Mesorhizobium sp. PAMC28654]